MFKLGDYPPAFFDKVFDIFIKHFDVNKEERQKFIEEYTIHAESDDGVYAITLLDAGEYVACYFCVPDIRYPEFQFGKTLTQDNAKKINDCQLEIEELTDRCRKFKVFL